MEDETEDSWHVAFFYGPYTLKMKQFPGESAPRLKLTSELFMEVYLNSVHVFDGAVSAVLKPMEKLPEALR